MDDAALRAVPTPLGTSTWLPIPHITLADLTRAALRSRSYDIIQEQHAVTANGERYFGLMQIAPRSVALSTDYSQVLGLRNSHDKCFPAGFVIGSGVFVCDNLAFSGEEKLARKHTIRILEELPGLIAHKVTRIQLRYEHQEKRLQHYRDTLLTDRDTHHLVIQAWEGGAIGTRQVKPLLKEWREPSHVEFQPRTAWSLFNACTEVLKSSPLLELPARTERLHSIFDRETHSPTVAEIEAPMLPL